MSRIEQKILTNLIHNEEYIRKVAPFIESAYFADKLDQVISQEIIAFFMKYNKLCTRDIIKIELSNRRDISDKELEEAQRIVDTLHPDTSNLSWLIQKTEKFCQDRAVYNAILNSIKIIEGKDKILSPDAIPNLLQVALAVSFDTNIGHDYIRDADERYDFYHRLEEKIAFDLELFNKITDGGMSKKSLTIVMAPTGVGKSLFMCHVTASTLYAGKNVLYLTMEMAEEKVAERIDANLMNLTMAELKTVDKESFDTRINRIKTKTAGKLIIKEYPTGSAHAGHFRALIADLRTKLDFVPDLIVVDYLNICASARMKMGASVNSYTYIKSIAEELRGLAVENNVPVLSATQTTRGGFDNSDISLTDTSESFGLPATADLMFAIIRTDELDELNQWMIKQLKNRYNDLSYYRKFTIGIDKARMKLYDVEQIAQEGISESGQEEPDVPAFDKGKFGKRMIDDNTVKGFKF